MQTKSKIIITRQYIKRSYLLTPQKFSIKTAVVKRTWDCMISRPEINNNTVLDETGSGRDTCTSFSRPTWRRVVFAKAVYY
jgi:hypothetical protein